MTDIIIDNYLEEINEDVLHELEPITSTLLYGTIAVAVNLTLLILSSKAMMKEFKDDKVLSKKVNDILGTKNWKVKIIKDKVPNALTIGNNIIYITTGLKTLLNDRELMAVLLHESYHIRDKHVLKHLLAQYPLFYLVAFILSTTGLIVPAYLFFLNIFIFNIMVNILMIPYQITMGRKHERDADAYSIKFGYAKDMISALNKLEAWYKKAIAKHECNSICRAVNKIDEMIDEHPSIRKRIAYILKQKDLYKKIMSGKFKLIKDHMLKGLGVDPKKEKEIKNKGA